MCKQASACCVRLFAQWIHLTVPKMPVQYWTGALLDHDLVGHVDGGQDRFGIAAHGGHYELERIDARLPAVDRYVSLVEIGAALWQRLILRQRIAFDLLPISQHEEGDRGGRNGLSIVDDDR
jgi:hypothetical protein